MRTALSPAALDIHFVWLPKQCSELNSMDQLWRELKGQVSANHQYPGIDEHAEAAENWLLSLTNKEALRKAGVLSKNFWLRELLAAVQPQTVRLGRFAARDGT